MQSFIDEEIRNRFSENAPLHHYLIRQKDDVIVFDYEYDSGLEVVTVLEGGSTKIDIVEYYINGEKTDGNQECLCHIPSNV